MVKNLDEYPEDLHLMLEAVGMQLIYQDVEGVVEYPHVVILVETVS